MDYIIKEELWRCVGIFAIFLVISISFFSEIKILESLFLILLIFPLIATFIVFLSFVLMRKNFINGVFPITVIMSLVLIVAGVSLSFFYRFSLSNILLVALGIISIIYGLSNFSQEFIYADDIKSTFIGVNY